MTNAITHLRTAKLILGSPEAWCKNSFAKDRNGAECFYVEPEKEGACSWCMIGAMELAAHRLGTEGYRDAAPEWKALKDIISAKVGEPTIAEWQDHMDRTHVEVLKAFDDAIELLLHRETESEATT